MNRNHYQDDLQSSPSASQFIMLENRLLDLPADVISEILSRLPIEVLLRFKSVCKSWCNLQKEPHFINLQANNASRQTPCIIAGRKKQTCSVDPLFLVDQSKGKLICKEIPTKYATSGDYTIVGSCNGLLCIASRHSIAEPLCIYNPITAEWKKLRPLQTSCLNPFFFYGFGFDSINKEYKVVCVYSPDWHPLIDGINFQMKSQIMTVGEGSWRKLDVPCKIRLSRAGLMETVFLNGAFYWITKGASRQSGQILALDISNEKFHTIDGIRPGISSNASLMIFQGSLVMVEYGYDVRLEREMLIVRVKTPDGWAYDNNCVNMFQKDELHQYCSRLTLLRRGEFLEGRVREDDLLETHSFVPTLVSPNSIIISTNDFIKRWREAKFLS